ncbi:hypothetical protein BDB01DRAFT_172999 [Pilobolus umbonatus]|nr:hypothetical protein BDB01DRAFT_172999 [Pilobolus umbonatus]
MKGTTMRDVVARCEEGFSAQIMSHQQKMNKVVHELNLLKNKNKMLELDQDEHLKTLDAQSKQIKELKENLAIKYAEIDQLTKKAKECEDLQHELHIFKEKLQATSADLSLLQTKYNNLKINYSQLQLQSQETTMVNESNMKPNEPSREYEDECQQTKEELLDEVKYYKGELDSCQALINQCREMMSNYEKKLQNQIKIQEDMISLTDKYERSTALNNELIKKLKFYSSIEPEVNSLRETVASTKDTLSVTQEENRALRDEVGIYKSLLAESEGRMKDEIAAYASCEADVGILKSLLAESNGNRTEYAFLEGQYTTSKQQLLAAQNELASCRKQVHVANEDYISCKKELENKKLELDIHKEEITSLKNTVSDYEDIIDELTSPLDKLTALRNKKKAMINKQKKELSLQEAMNSCLDRFNDNEVQELELSCKKNTTEDKKQYDKTKNSIHSNTEAIPSPPSSDLNLPNTEAVPILSFPGLNLPTLEASLSLPVESLNLPTTEVVPSLPSKELNLPKHCTCSSEIPPISSEYHQGQINQQFVFNRYVALALIAIFIFNL